VKCRKGSNESYWFMPGCTDSWILAPLLLLPSFFMDAPLTVPSMPLSISGSRHISSIFQYVNRQDLDEIFSETFIVDRRNTTRNTKSVDAAHKK
jgi:hypothetical protein